MSNLHDITKVEPIIFTIGYEKSVIEDYIATLKKAKIETLVDVRRYPISRKKGFSKTAFRKALEEENIKYLHLVELGCPNEIRDRYKIDSDWQTYTIDFLNYLSSQKDYIDELAKLSEHTAICLTCFERDYTMCHRSMVANAIIKNSKGGVRHLGVKKGLASVELV